MAIPYSNCYLNFVQYLIYKHLKLNLSLFLTNHTVAIIVMYITTLDGPNLFSNDLGNV